MPKIECPQYLVAFAHSVIRLPFEVIFKFGGKISEQSGDGCVVISTDGGLVEIWGLFPLSESPSSSLSSPWLFPPAPAPFTQAPPPNLEAHASAVAVGVGDVIVVGTVVVAVVVSAVRGSVSVFVLSSGGAAAVGFESPTVSSPAYCTPQPTVAHALQLPEASQRPS